MYVPYTLYVCAIYIDRHLVCFCVLTIVSSAAMNIRVCVSLCIIVLLDICPGVRFLDHMVILLLVF